MNRRVHLSVGSIHMLEFMDLGVENIRGSNHPPTLSGKIAYFGEDQFGRCLPWMAYTYYTFSDSHNSARQVRNMTSEAEVVSGQHY